MSLTDFVPEGPGEEPVLGADFGEVIGHLRKELRGLLPHELGDAVEQLQLFRSMLDSVMLEAVNSFGRSQEWLADGYRYPTAWVKDRCRLPKHEAARQVRLGRRLETMPHTAEALAAGEVSIFHVDKLSKANRPDWADKFAESEELLVDCGRTLDFRGFCQAVDYFMAVVDPDPDRADAARDAKRYCYSSEVLDGMGKIDALLDPVGFATVDTVLRKIEKELFEADWAEGVAEYGKANMSADKLRRTSAQRRADALVEMATRASSTPEGSRRPEPSVIVHIDAETLEAALKERVGADYEFGADRTCELQDGTVISPNAALALALEGHVRRMVFDGPSTTFGRNKRFFTGGLRELIEARDRHCQGPGCDIAWWPPFLGLAASSLTAFRRWAPKRSQPLR